MPLLPACKADVMGVATAHALDAPPNEQREKLHPAINRVSNLSLFLNLLPQYHV